MLTDAQWERIAGYLPGREGTPGRSGVDNRLFVDAILWMAGTAAHWRDLPEAFGKWTAVHARFRRWSHKGVWKRLLHALADTPDFEYVLIDSPISKVHAAPIGANGGLMLPPSAARADGQSDVKGNGWSVRVSWVGARYFKKKNTKKK